jgi:glycerol-3-phosphate dehydrogenase
MNRTEIRKALEQQFDLLIIGGGVTGVGTARDAAMRGIKTVVLDMNDVAFGTSSRSSKLVHGGLRYLEHAEFALVFESVSERRILMDIAPHLVMAQGFLFPVFTDSRRSLFEINVGMWLYDGLSLFRSPKIHKSLSKKKLKEEEPALRQKGLKGAPLYYDCATDDARLTLETAVDAKNHGAVVATYTRVLSFLKEDGRIVGVRVRDELSGEEFEIQSHSVVNATGPWSDRIRSLSKEDVVGRLRPTKGIHIVIPTEKLYLNNAVVCFHPQDGRVLFAIPWGDRTYIGTTDTDYQEDPADVAASSEDVHYLVDVTNHYFPGTDLHVDDVISTWAGVRPLVADEKSDDESAISREHTLALSDDGLITIAGGKLTTYRKMAAEVVDKSIEYLRVIGALPKVRSADTSEEPLPGAVGWPEEGGLSWIEKELTERFGELLQDETRVLLAKTYGMRSFDVVALIHDDESLAEKIQEDRPEIMAQIRFGIEEELAYTLRDIFIRRTQLFFRAGDQGLGAIDRVATYMKKNLDWDDIRVEKEKEEYRTEVDRSRSWQKE